MCSQNVIRFNTIPNEKNALEQLSSSNVASNEGMRTIFRIHNIDMNVAKTTELICTTSIKRAIFSFVATQIIVRGHNIFYQCVLQ